MDEAQVECAPESTNQDEVTSSTSTANGDGPTKPCVRVDFYQTEMDVVVTVFIKQRSQEQVQVEFGEEKFGITVQLPDGSEYCNQFQLAKRINVSCSSFKILSTKIEIKLRKEEACQWATLEASKTNRDIGPTYPTSSKKKSDWDKVEKEIERENPDLDDNNVFAKLYESADENAQKAMVKSMQESGGTCLNMNWAEVSKKRVPIDPPDGIEFKKWD